MTAKCSAWALQNGTCLVTDGTVLAGGRVECELLDDGHPVHTSGSWRWWGSMLVAHFGPVPQSPVPLPGLTLRETEELTAGGHTELVCEPHATQEGE